MTCNIALLNAFFTHPAFKLTAGTFAAPALSLLKASFSRLRPPRLQERVIVVALDPLEAALAHVSDAVITIDASFRVTYLNAAAEAMTGWAAAKASGQPLSTVVTILAADDSQQAVDLSAAAVAVTSFRPATLVGATGNPSPIDFNIVPLAAGAGTANGSVILLRDTALLRAAEFALKTSKDTLRASAEELFEERERSQVTLKSIGDAVISTDFRGHVTFLNIIAEQLTGWTQAEASGRPLDEIFVVIDCETRAQIPCPTMTAIIENRRVGMEQTCLLLPRGGAQIDVEVSASPIHDKNGGVVGAVMVSQDVTAARDLSRKLERLALHDTLTELPNRALFADRLDQALVRANRSGGAAAVFFVDLDRFKPVNDSLGHAVGDLLLKAVAQRLLSCVRHSDTVCRHGGDEFIILIADIARTEDAMLCAEKVKLAFDAPYEVGDHRLQITASIGVAGYPDAATDVETLLKYADTAMYQAKRAGRNNYQFFRKSMLEPDGGASGNDPTRRLSVLKQGETNIG